MLQERYSRTSFAPSPTDSKSGSKMLLPLLPLLVLLVVWLASPLSPFASRPWRRGEFNFYRTRQPQRQQKEDGAGTEPGFEFLKDVDQADSVSRNPEKRG